MDAQTAASLEAAIAYIEKHLSGPLRLDAVADAAHYSKYHLHRLFRERPGMTVHAYARRRRLTRGAYLLVNSRAPVLDIALLAGYESQQAFTDAFRAFYKLSPARYRQSGVFYPLQWPCMLRSNACPRAFSGCDVAFARPGDLPEALSLARACVDGYPCLREDEFLRAMRRFTQARRLLLVRAGGALAGLLAFECGGHIAYLAVHPQCRRRGAARALIDRLQTLLPEGQAVSITTFRAGDKADPGWRAALLRLGFAPAGRLTEYGYPTQRFVLPPAQKEDGTHERMPARIDACPTL